MDRVRLLAVWQEEEVNHNWPAMEHTFRERRLHPVLPIRGGLALRQLLKIAFSALRASTEGNYSKVWACYSNRINLGRY